MTTLLMSSRHSMDDQFLWRAAIQRGWSVVRARGLRVPEIDDDDIKFYAELLFAPSIAENLGYRLLDPPEDWLARLPKQLAKREISTSTMRDAQMIDSPTFVKPPNDKSFQAKVYENGRDLPDTFDPNMTVLVATPVKWESEFRCFCLHGRVVTISPYLRNGELAITTDYEMSQEERELAIRTAESALEVTSIGTPSAVVIDVGKIESVGWAVVEANGAWGSGIYGCEPDSVLNVIYHASERVLESK